MQVIDNVTDIGIKINWLSQSGSALKQVAQAIGTVHNFMIIQEEKKVKVNIYTYVFPQGVMASSSESERVLCPMVAAGVDNLSMQ